MRLIVADDLTKTCMTGSVRIEALEHVTCVIGSASFVSFSGPSGSGKTTLLNLIGALDRPTSGRLTVSNTAHRWTAGQQRSFEAVRSPLSMEPSIIWRLDCVCPEAPVAPL